LFSFFFQAEDGIRDFHVTGVQTCALPISAVDKSIHNPNIFINSNVLGTQNLVNLSVKYGVKKFLYQSSDEIYGALNSMDDAAWRSEERRVGKECRDRRSASQDKKS